MSQKMTLSKRLEGFRIDRPDEWTMDEFARLARLLEAQRDELLAAAQRLQRRGFFRGSALNNPGEMEDITLMTAAIAKAVQP